MDPEHIMQVGMGFFASKTLLSAVELGVFTELASQPTSADGLGERLGLHPRGRRDFFDGLVALGFLDREGDGPDAVYSNAPDSAQFLDRNQPTYIGGILEMANARLYHFWGSLTEGLRTGQPQNEIMTGGEFFGVLYQDPARLKQFMHAMTGISMGAAKAIAQKFPWQKYRTFIDIGAAEGGLPVQIALAHPHLSGGGFDLPAVREIFDEYVASFANAVAGRLRRDKRYVDEGRRLDGAEAEPRDGGGFAQRDRHDRHRLRRAAPRGA